jgi:hypothetical protein
MCALIGAIAMSAGFVGHEHFGPLKIYERILSVVGGTMALLPATRVWGLILMGVVAGIVIFRTVSLHKGPATR